MGGPIIIGNAITVNIPPRPYDILLGPTISFTRTGINTT